MTARHERRRLIALALTLLATGGGLAIWLVLDGGKMAGTDNADIDPQREVAYWVAPMDPNYRRDGPGKSPMGMDLVPVYADEAGEPGVIRISAATRTAMGVRLGEARLESLSPTVHAPGRVEFHQGRRHYVHPRVSGWIETLAVRTTGESVERGQALFELYSPQLVSAQEDMLQVLRGGSEGAIAAGRERLRALGVSRQQIDALVRDRRVRQTLTFHAPIAGVIEALHVANGARVEPGTRIMTLADRSSVWLIADVPSSHAARVAPGQPATVRFPHRPGEERATRVELVYPELDRDTRTVRARMPMDNDGGDLRPGLFASVRIEVPATEPVVTVPEQAVIRTGRQDRIVLARPGGRFEVRPVEIGIAADGRREIRAGVEPGERIVTAGQFLIDSETSLEAESERMAGASAIDERFETRGEITAIDRAERTLTLAHEPVEALDWPAMTMDFVLDENVELDGLQPGSRVEFEFRARDGGGHEITELEVVEADADGDTGAGR